MKKRFLAGVLMSGAVAAPVHAQSSVTIYGLIDQGVNYVNSAQTGGRGNGRSQVALSDGAVGIGGSRWGLRGTEDLGGGLHAIFTLENGFNINTGALTQGGLMFGRQIFVGLDSSEYGQITFGRQYSIVSDFVAPVTEVGEIPGHMGANPDDLDDFGHSIRLNNTAKFKTVPIHGFTFGGMYGLGGVAGDFTRNQTWALAGSYKSGPLMAAVGYLNARDPNLSYFGTSGNSGPATTDNLGSLGSLTAAQSNPIYAGFASAGTLSILAGGAKYSFGSASIGASYSHVTFDHLGSPETGPNPLHYAGTAIFNNGEVNASYQLTPTVSVNAAYSYTRKASVGEYGEATYHQFELSSAYLLSKRTKLYALAIYQKASGTDSLGQPAVASITQATPSATDKQVLVRLGILHTF